MRRSTKSSRKVLSWVDAACYPFLIGPAGLFKTSAAAKVAEVLGRPFHMDSMSDDAFVFIAAGKMMFWIGPPVLPLRASSER